MKRNSMQTAAALTGMRAIRDNRYLGRLREQRWRRALVTLIAVAAVITVAAMTRDVRTDHPWLWLAGVSLTALLWVALTLATRNVGSSIDAFADERDRAVRDRAHRIAYWIIGVPLGASLGALVGWVAGVAERAEPVLIDASHEWALTALLFVILVLYATLPVAIIGWTEPDPPAEEP
jgi:hypothetical protein